MINFPDSPAVNDTFTAPNGVFIWDGVKWEPQGVASSGGGGGFTTGDVKLTWKITPDSGWMMMDDGTIGNTGSGASHTGTQYQALFTVYYANLSDANAPLLTSSGAATTRAAQGTASAAWAANCRMTMPLVLGRAMAIAGAGAGLTSLVIGQALGANNNTASFTLATANLPAHSHTITDLGHNHSASSASSSSPHYHTPSPNYGGGDSFFTNSYPSAQGSQWSYSGGGYFNFNNINQTNSVTVSVSTTTNVNNNSTGITGTNNAGSGAAVTTNSFSAMQPTASLNIMVKL